MATEPEDDFEEEEVDVEEFVKQGKRVPRAKRYRIRIDKERYVVNAPFITKAELLALVGKTADKWRIHQKLRGGQWMRSPTARRSICARRVSSGSSRWNWLKLTGNGGAGGAARPSGVSTCPKKMPSFSTRSDWCGRR